MIEDKGSPVDNSGTCARCGGHTKVSERPETFTYGDGPARADLTVDVPVHVCTSCGYQYTDDAADVIRHEAVCRHLGVMTPQEIFDIRKRTGLSQSDFSRLTGIGEASLSRWENASKIQNPAMDRYLYLLQFTDTLSRLKDRSSRVVRQGACVLQFAPKFRAFDPNPEEISVGRSWSLNSAMHASR